MGYVAFDIEIATDIPEGTADWHSLGLLGISCAATLTDAGELRLWFGQEDGGNYAPRMSPAEVGELIIYLNSQIVDHDRRPVTWNGLGFDFRVLADESQFPEPATLCKTLALVHIDVAFQMLCEKGFMIGLNAAAKGMGLAGKTEGMNGAKAPAMWQQGRDAQEQVLEYVAQDVRTTAGVYEAILRKRSLVWTSRRGSPAIWSPAFSGDRLLTVAEALQLPEPDTSWLPDPWPRSKFSGWLAS